MRLRLLTTAMLWVLCGVLPAQNTSYQQDPGWRAPADAVSRPNPLARKPEAAAGGEKLFKRNCVECHGADGSGVPKKNAANLLLPEVQSQSDGTLFWKITNGNTDRGMPSFSRLPELQRWQLVLYLRTLKPITVMQPKDPGK
jgi:mono/diheme cytochrome c family protein